MENTYLDKKSAYKHFVKQAKEDRKKHFKSLIVAMILLAIPAALIYAGLEFLGLGGESFTGSIISFFLNTLLTMYFLKYTMNLVDEKGDSIRKVFKLPAKQVAFYILATLLSAVLIQIGLFLFIIPGLILAYMFLFIPFISLDKTINPIKALSEGKSLTSGYKMAIFRASLNTFFRLAGLPILLILGGMLTGVLAAPLGLPVLSIFSVLLVIAGAVFMVWANIAIQMVLPRMYRDLQKIKEGAATAETSKESE